MFSWLIRGMPIFPSRFGESAPQSWMQTPLGNLISHVLLLGTWSTPPSHPPRLAAGSHRTPRASVVSLGLPDPTHLKSGFLFMLEMAPTNVRSMNWQLWTNNPSTLRSEE